jgi:chemotaxis protein methyltransferase CheR
MKVFLMLPMSQNEFFKLVEYVKNNFGIDLTKKKILVESRLSSLLSERQIPDYETYLQSVFHDHTGKEMTELLNRITTNLTYFMREASHFEYLVHNVFPWLQRTVEDRDVRLWSAGCSSGEEAYTLAMLLNDYFKGLNGWWDTKVLATDISEKVLNTAQKGIYSSEMVETLPASWKTKYFQKNKDGTFTVCNEIKNEVIFAPFNLMEEKLPFKKRFHVIFCRNVMIYFDQRTKANLISRFCNATEPGGYLFIGHSESVGNHEKGYQYIMPATYRKISMYE